MRSCTDNALTRASSNSRDFAAEALRRGRRTVPGRLESGCMAINPLEHAVPSYRKPPRGSR